MILLFPHALSGINISSCQDGEIRLVDGRTQFEGRVEICEGELWGSVCHDKWDTNDVSTVCRQLGQNDSSKRKTIYKIHCINYYNCQN